MQLPVLITFTGFLILIMAFAGDNKIQLDGIINGNEWSDAREHRLSGGRKLLVKRQGDDLYIAMAGDKQSWAHVYLHSGDTIHVYHASAALGEAKYIQQNKNWIPVQAFQWQLREKEYNSDLIQKQEAYYLKNGWVANNNNMGNGMSFEFKLDLSRKASRYFACVLAEAPLDIHHFPAGLSDDTILAELVQGNTADSLQFDPSRWEKIK